MITEGTQKASARGMELSHRKGSLLDLNRHGMCAVDLSQLFIVPFTYCASPRSHCPSSSTLLLRDERSVNRSSYNIIAVAVTGE